MRYVSDKVVEKINIFILFKTFFFSENLAVYEMTWKNMVQPDRPHENIRGLMHFACWKQRLQTLLEYLILIL